LRNCGFYLVWGFGSQSKKSCSLAILVKSGLCKSVQNDEAVRFISSIHEGQRIVLEDDNFHGNSVLFRVSTSPNQHDKPPSPDMEIIWRPG